MADKRAKRRAEAEQHMLMMQGGDADQDGGFTDEEGNFINLDAAEDEEVMVDEAGGADHHDQDIVDAATHAAIDNEVEENIFTVRQPGASDDDNEATQTARPGNEEPPAAAEPGNDKKALVDEKLNQDRQTAEKPLLKEHQQTEDNVEDKKQEDDSNPEQ